MPPAQNADAALPGGDAGAAAGVGAAQPPGANGNLLVVQAAKTFADWRWGSLGEATEHFVRHRHLLVPNSDALTRLKQETASRNDIELLAAELFCRHGILEGLYMLWNTKPPIRDVSSTAARKPPATRGRQRQDAADAAPVEISDDSDDPYIVSHIVVLRR